MGRVIRAEQQGPKLVLAPVVDALAQARAIVERAHGEAAAVRAAALDAGRAQAQAELAAQLLELTQAHARVLAALEPQAIELALLAAKRVIGTELAARPELIGDMIAPLLERLRRAHRLELRVHPDDRAALERQLDALRRAAHPAATLQIESDAALSRGSCVVVSDVGSLDARVETQLSALARALGGA
jgi:flagellar biosynthesis/type III secretory pathway protein FliH